MKRMKKIFIVLIVLFCTGRVVAQTTQVQIIDLYASQVVIPDKNGEIDTSHITFHIGFKIKNVEQARTARFLLGSAIDLGNVLNLTARLIATNGSFALQLNGKQFNVKGYDAYIEIVLTAEEYKNVKYITAYVEDTAAIKTKSLYSQLY